MIRLGGPAKMPPLIRLVTAFRGHAKNIVGVCIIRGTLFNTPPARRRAAQIFVTIDFGCSAAVEPARLQYQPWSYVITSPSER